MSNTNTNPSDELPDESAATELTNAPTIEQDIKEKIIHILTIYPFLSRAMIQTGLSPALPPKLWGPILDRMVEEGVVTHYDVQTVAPNGRNLVKGIFHLPTMKHPTLHVENTATLV